MDEQHEIHPNMEEVHGDHKKMNHEAQESENSRSITIQGYYDEYSKGDWVHCNRFNGPASDNVHYPKSHWRAALNFVGRYCQLAITINKKYGSLCALDYTSNTWCNGYGGAAACSGVIGHSKTYHKH